ncbi:high choriolytic enzyme 1-like [Esox lucius]|uniref:high choriolytic enzyme 1-like n=1 Tax=Esox lucius TaxID=8010 RepID=UPI0014768811|nr:high choriolytic enzyme 1-like [Esox lucius]
MSALRYTLGLLALLVVAAYAEEEDLSVPELLEKANQDVVHTIDEPLVEDDIAYSNEDERNADPCTSRSCIWPKSSDGKVYVPYTLSSAYSDRERSVIERGLQSFATISCIRFIKRTNQKDYLAIQSLEGCYSFIGRQGKAQTVSLARSGCVYHGTTQHEVLHALGFHHEQKRSDRDSHIRIHLENVISGKENNFKKIATLNQNTGYDYKSVMHYGKFAFSKNNKATMVPIPNQNVEIGKATEMSQNDINRLKRLYKC